MSVLSIIIGLLLLGLAAFIIVKNIIAIVKIVKQRKLDKLEKEKQENVEESK